MTPDNSSYSSGSSNSYSSSGFAIGDTVINTMDGSPNIGTWGKVVSVTGTGSNTVIGYIVGNSEYPYQTGWTVYDLATNLELHDA
jgi:hypothetical protein